eukprot:Tbor_TRINITY_DN5210_c0_g2::TRINITY_DN5210_c0_g2_i1::g.16211::m.16211
MTSAMDELFKENQTLANENRRLLRQISNFKRDFNMREEEHQRAYNALMCQIEAHKGVIAKERALRVEAETQLSIMKKFPRQLQKSPTRESFVPAYEKKHASVNSMSNESARIREESLLTLQRSTPRSTRDIYVDESVISRSNSSMYISRLEDNSSLVKSSFFKLKISPSTKKEIKSPFRSEKLGSPRSRRKILLSQDFQTSETACGAEILSLCREIAMKFCEGAAELADRSHHSDMYGLDSPLVRGLTPVTDSQDHKLNVSKQRLINDLYMLFTKELGAPSVADICATVTERDLLDFNVPLIKARIVMQIINEHGRTIMRTKRKQRCIGNEQPTVRDYTDSDRSSTVSVETEMGTTPK